MKDSSLDDTFIEIDVSHSDLDGSCFENEVFPLKWSKDSESCWEVFVFSNVFLWFLQLYLLTLTFNFWQSMEKREPVYSVDENLNWYSSLEMVWRFLKKLKQNCHRIH